MLRPRIVLAWMLGCGLTAALGCELRAELGSYSGAETNDSEPEPTQTGGDSEQSSTQGESEAGDGGSGDGDSGDGDGDELCAIDGSETPCGVCLEHLCCAELQACNVEAGCFCMLDCLDLSEPAECAMSCTPGVAYFELVVCEATSCPAVCD